jgi:hypothetical protein
MIDEVGEHSDRTESRKESRRLWGGGWCCDLQQVFAVALCEVGLQTRVLFACGRVGKHRHIDGSVRRKSRPDSCLAQYDIDDAPGSRGAFCVADPHGEGRETERMRYGFIDAVEIRTRVGIELCGGPMTRSWDCVESVAGGLKPAGRCEVWDFSVADRARRFDAEISDGLKELDSAPELIVPGVPEVVKLVLDPQGSWLVCAVARQRVAEHLPCPLPRFALRGCLNVVQSCSLRSILPPEF